MEQSISLVLHGVLVGPSALPAQAPLCVLVPVHGTLSFLLVTREWLAAVLSGHFHVWLGPGPRAVN